MMQQVTDVIHLRSTRAGRVYRVTALDPDTKQVTLRGLHGSFVEQWAPARLKAIGYERVVGPFEGMIEIEDANAE